MKSIKLIIICLLALCTLLPAAEAAWQPEISIGLQQGQSTIQLKLLQNTQVFLEGEGKAAKEFPAGSQLNISHDGRHFLINGKKFKGSELQLKAAAKGSTGTAVFAASQHSYKGVAKVTVRQGKLTLVNVIAVEAYLAGVVPEEMPYDWPMEAIKAQAVAARTYALENRKRHEAEGFDLCAATHCQQYLGAASERTSTNQALAATCGEVLTYQGKPIEALFHTDSGGMTENSEDVWGTKLPYLRAATEAELYTKPWKNTFTAERIASLVSKHSSKDIGKLKKIELSPLKIGRSEKDRTASGRVRQAVFVGSKGRAAVSGNDLRSLLGLRSTMFNLSLDHQQVIVDGYGWGHGLGLSQWGARKWAEKGKGYRDILAHYYQQATLKKLY